MASPPPELGALCIATLCAPIPLMESPSHLRDRPSPACHAPGFLGW